MCLSEYPFHGFRMANLERYDTKLGERCQKSKIYCPNIRSIKDLRLVDQRVYSNTKRR